MRPTFRTRASPACSQPGGHGPNVPAVLRAVHRSALPAARLGAGRLHVQVSQLHPAGARAEGRRAGGGVWVWAGSDLLRAGASRGRLWRWAGQSLGVGGARLPAAW